MSMWVLAVSVVIICVGMFITIILQLRELAQRRVQQDTHLAASQRRDAYLDFLIRKLHLHLHDPYIDRPTFEEKRCYHCNYPIYAMSHDPECLWLLMRPFTSTQFPHSPKQ